jgi:hypothetical protein
MPTWSDYNLWVPCPIDEPLPLRLRWRTKLIRQASLRSWQAWSRDEAEIFRVAGVAPSLTSRLGEEETAGFPSLLSLKREAVPDTAARKPGDEITLLWP